MSISVLRLMERVTTNTSRREATAGSARIGLTDAMRSSLTMTSENMLEMKEMTSMLEKRKTVLEEQADQGIPPAAFSSERRC